MILGIDEVGRGAWAGPVVVGAVAIEPQLVPGLTDSKLLSKQKRVLYAADIRRYAAWIGIGWVSAHKIDEIGMSAALKLAARRAIAGFPAEKMDEIIIDGTLRLVDAPNVTLLKKADLLIPAVSAASIVAKVARDRYMQSLHELFPDYGFDQHVGYGTARHQQALLTHGPSSIHRMTFAPMSSAGRVNQVPVRKFSSGYKAEQAAADYLQAQGFEILDRNWKTKTCEIDIIARRDGSVYFIEVKFRSNARQGQGLDYITPGKQQQMHFAAEMWRAANKYAGPMQLAAAQASGDDFIVTDLVLDIPASGVRHAGTRRFGS